MNLKQLHLKAYGSFTDTLLDFPGPEGLHLVWGQNEAGKSVALRALTAALFGVPGQTRDNFLHENPALRIGAVLRHSDGTELSFFRRKGNKDTLLDENESAIAANSLVKFLGPVSQDLFLKMFGLTLDQLVAGGEDLARDGGELGASLFAAGAGIGNLRKVLMQLDSEAGELFAPQAQKRKINALISEYRKHAKAAKGASLPARAWQKLDGDLHEQRQRLEEVESELRDKRIVELRLDRIIKVAPLVGELAETNRKLGELGEVIVLPDDFRERRRENEKELRETSVRISGMREKLEETEKEITDIESPGDLLEHGDEIDRLYEESGNYRQGLSQLPRLEPEVGRLEKQRDRAVRELASDYSGEKAEELCLPVAQRAEIERLAAEFTGLKTGIATAADELANSEAELQLQEKDSKQEQPRDVSSLDSFLTDLAGEGITPKRREELAGEVDNESQNLRVRLERLGLWKGTLADFETTADIPSEGTVSQFEDRLLGLATHSDQLKANLAHEQLELADLCGQITSLQAGKDVRTEKDLRDSRARRERGWGLVRKNWLDSQDVSEDLKVYAPDARNLAEAYEQSVSGADSVADSLMHESERAAQLAALIERKNACDDKIEGFEQGLADAKSERDDVNEEWSEAWKPCGIAPKSPREMRDWLQDRARILEGAEQLRKLQGQFNSLSKTIEARAESLETLLREVGQEIPDGAALGTLRQLAVALIEKNREQIAEQNKQEALLQNARTAVDSRRAKLEREEANEQSWREEWTAALEPTWLSADSSPAQAKAVLERLADLSDTSEKIDEKASRISAIKSDHTRFKKEVKALSEAVERPTDSTDPADFVKQLLGALKDALKKQTKLQEKAKARDEINSTIAGLEAKADVTGKALQAQMDAAGCKEASSLPEAEQRSATSASLKDDADDLRKQISQIAEQQDVNAFIAEVEAVDTDQAKAELESLREETAKLSEARSEANQKIGALENELEKMEGGDDAVQNAEKMEGFLAEIRVASEEYARLRVSSAVLRKEIERYREENQGPVMKRASEIFKDLTLGSFDGLTSDFDSKDNQILVGEKGGKRVTVAGMSNGTRDQLFLALRLASLENRDETQEPIPLVLDDILVNFDNERSGACLKVLATIAEKTQIILFTHHRHILDIAEQELAEGAYAVHMLS